jgi:hypothetical protein
MTNLPNLMAQCYIDRCIKFNLPIKEHGLSAYNIYDDVIVWINEQPHKNLYEIIIII